MQHSVTPCLASRGRAARNRRGDMRNDGGYQEPHKHWFCGYLLPCSAGGSGIGIQYCGPSTALFSRQTL